jgi:RNA polymerase subunit RPABC4/transcription elongation factor Spt4
MSDLLKGSAQTTKKPCEKCGSFVNPGDVICTQCGYDTATGKFHKTAVTVEKAKEAEEPKKSSRSGFSTFTSLEAIPPIVLFSVVAAIGAGPLLAGLLMENSTLVLVGIGAASIVQLVCGLWIIINAFRENAMKGLVLLISPCLFLGIFYWLYYVFVENDDPHERAMFAGLLVAWLIGVAAHFGAFAGSLPGGLGGT